MNIAVCIKQVPDTHTIRIDEKRMTIVREGGDNVINALDCVALEAALDLKARRGGSITVLTMGPPQSEEALREALGYGADTAILLSDPAFAGADTLATSHVLARAISRLEPFPDLILCGKQTSDSDTGHVGPQIAEELDLPQVCGVDEIHLEENALVVKRLSDGLVETFRLSLPALLTVSNALCAPRRPSFGDLEAAFSMGSVRTWRLDDLGLNPDEVGASGSATWVVKLRSAPPKARGEIVSGPTQDLVDRLIKKLEALSVIDEESRSQ